MTKKTYNICSNIAHFTVASYIFGQDTYFRKDHVDLINNLNSESGLQVIKYYNKSFLVRKVYDFRYKSMRSIEDVDTILYRYCKRTIQFPNVSGMLYVPALGGKTTAAKSFDKYTDSDAVPYKDDKIHKGRGVRLTDRPDEIYQAKEDGILARVILIIFNEVVEKVKRLEPTDDSSLYARLSLNNHFLHSHNFNGELCIYCTSVDFNKTSISCKNACFVRFENDGFIIYEPVVGSELDVILHNAALYRWASRGMAPEKERRWEDTMLYDIIHKSGRLSMKGFDPYLIKVVRALINDYRSGSAESTASVYFEPKYITFVVSKTSLFRGHIVIRYCIDGSFDVIFNNEDDYQALMGTQKFDVSIPFVIGAIFSMKN